MNTHITYSKYVQTFFFGEIFKTAYFRERISKVFLKRDIVFILSFAGYSQSLSKLLIATGVAGKQP